MGRIPKDVEKVITALCHDYPRRRRLLDKNLVGGNVRKFFLHINGIIDKALEEECEEGIRESMLEDLAENRGYRKSPIYCISQDAYYDRKRRLRISIARKLNLI